MSVDELQTDLGALSLDRDTMLTYIVEKMDDLRIDDRQTVLNMLQAGVKRSYIMQKPSGSILRTAHIPNRLVREIYDYINIREDDSD